MEQNEHTHFYLLLFPALLGIVSTALAVMIGKTRPKGLGCLSRWSLVTQSRMLPKETSPKELQSWSCWAKGSDGSGLPSSLASDSSLYKLFPTEFFSLSICVDYQVGGMVEESQGW